jgi:hypothetical protein
MYNASGGKKQRMSCNNCSKWFSYSTNKYKLK